jgi:hypothetical protein
MRKEAAKADVSTIASVVEILREAASQADSGKYAEMGVVLMAVLSTMKNQQSIPAIKASLPQDQPKSSSKGKKPSSALVDFESIPNPMAGTLLAGVVDSIELQTSSKSFAVLLTSNAERSRRELSEDECLTMSMSVLESVSLPGQFEDNLIVPLMRMERESTTLSCISLICSQLQGRRRAIFDGRDFTRTADRMAKSPIEDWRRQLAGERGLKLFAKSLPDIVTKMTSETIQFAVENTWRNCVAAKAVDRSLQTVFLSSMEQLLASSTLSPKVLGLVRISCLQLIVEDLFDEPLESLRVQDDKSPSLLEQYVRCLLKIPQNVLDDSGFFTLTIEGFDAEALKMVCLTALIESDYFGTQQRETEELSSVALWLSKKLSSCPEESEQHTLRHVMASFAAVTLRETSAAKRERIASLFEVLLLTKKAGSRLGIQLLAILLAYWCHGRGSDAELTLGFLCVADARLPLSLQASALEDLFEIVVEDLPANISTYTSKDKLLGPVVLNYLYRVLSHWSNCGADGDILFCVRKCIISYQQKNHRNRMDEDIFVSLVTSTLIAQSQADSLS